jgi:O-antigen/teichoic acid export membrane protein
MAPAEVPEPEAPGGTVGAGLLGESLSVYATQISVTALQIASGILLARALAPSGRGAYAIVVLVPVSLVSLGSLGQAMVNAHLAARNEHPGSSLLSNSLTLAAVLGLVYGVAARGLLDPTWRWLRGVDGRLLSLGCAMIPLLLATGYLEALLVGAGRIRERNRVRLLGAGLLFGLLAVLGSTGRLTLTNACFAWAVNVAVTAGAMLWTCRRRSPGPLKPDSALLKWSLRKGLTGAAGPACTFLLLRSDLFLVNYFMAAGAVGHYAVTAGLANLLLLLPSSVGMAFLPRASRMGEKCERHLSPLVCRLTSWLSLATAVVLVPVAPFLVRLFYGEAYLPSVRPLVVLVPGIVMASMGLVLGSHLQGRGLFYIGALATGLGLMVNIVLNLWLIPVWGLEGAALSSSLSYGLTALVLLVAVTKDAGVSWREMVIPRVADWRFLVAESR